MSNKVQTLDVRADLQNGREPFSKIMQTVGTLRPGERLKLVAPFEPTPLYAVLAQRGYSHETRSVEDHFEVLFTPEEAAPPKSNHQAPENKIPDHAKVCPGSPVLEVDARGQEPPQPLVTILEAVASLPAGARLRALTDRRPMHLYAQLEERGFVGTSEQVADGTFVTEITRR